MLNTQVYDNPCGYITNEQLTFLFRCLEAHRDLNTLICMHHNAFKVNCAWLDQHDLKNSSEFVSLLQSYSNVKCVLCGHVHQENDFYNGTLRFISSPSTSMPSTMTRITKKFRNITLPYARCAKISMSSSSIMTT